jgi:ABC-2 type transport system permease protein
LVLVGGGVTVAVLHQAYDIDWPLDALKALSERINHTLVHNGRALAETLQNQDGGSLVSWAVQDLGHTLAELASLQFVGWAAVAAAAFALIVIKRARGG